MTELAPDPILDRWVKGELTAKQIAAEIGARSHSYVLDHVKRKRSQGDPRAIGRAPVRSGMTQADLALADRAREMRAAGLSHAEIAARCERSPTWAKNQTQGIRVAYRRAKPTPAPASYGEPDIRRIHPAAFIMLPGMVDRFALAEVGPSGCHWPIDVEGAPAFCGAPREDHESYCPAHHAMSIGPGTRAEQFACSNLGRI